MFVRFSISVVVEIYDTSPVTAIMTVTDMGVSSVANTVAVNITFSIDHTVTATVVTAVSVAVTFAVTDFLSES